MIQSVRLVIGLQDPAGFIHCHHRVLTVVQDHADDVAFGPFGVDAVGSLHGLGQRPPQRLHPQMHIGAWHPPLLAEVVHRAAADQRIHAVRLAGLLVLYVVNADLCTADLFHGRHQILKLVPVQAEPQMGGMISLPAAAQCLQHIQAVKYQLRDMLLRIQVTDFIVGDAPGHDHVIPVQLPQDLRRAETVNHINVHLIAAVFLCQLPHWLHQIRRRREHHHIYHVSSFPREKTS